MKLFGVSFCFTYITLDNEEVVAQEYQWSQINKENRTKEPQNKGQSSLFSQRSKKTI
jgi:hypothetical protein